MKGLDFQCKRVFIRGLTDAVTEEAIYFSLIWVRVYKYKTSVHITQFKSTYLWRATNFPRFLLYIFLSLRHNIFQRLRVGITYFQHGEIDEVRKQGDYAFVTFKTHEGALSTVSKPPAAISGAEVRN